MFNTRSPKCALRVGRWPIFVLLLIAFVAAATNSIRAQVPSPVSVLGFTPGDDRKIADWNDITNYFARLDKASSRVKVEEIGRTTNGAPMIVAFISAPGNIKRLEKYRSINARLADPRTISGDAEAAELIKNGKAIVSISCSIHSTEIVASQMSMNLAYELATANDARTREILDNTILLLIPSSNPDGIDIVSHWYRKTLGTPAEGTSPPELYHHYAGHDDNRDWFMMNLVETREITKLFWQQWFPEIVYDVHQQGRNASRFILPPFYDPVNPRVDPVILREVGLIGSKMAADLQDKGVAGVATNSTYDTWWHGGFRSAPYFHNSIGILSEAASVDLMTPVDVKLEELKRSRPVRGLPSLLDRATNYPDPWLGGEWHARDINNIEMTASLSLLEMAAKFRGRYLQNFYDLGKQALAHHAGDPYAYVIKPRQTMPENAARLIEVLRWQGIRVYQTTSEIKTSPSAEADMPAGTFVIPVDQPQRNNVLSLFERQHYPDRRLPGGEAEVPYDIAGWTLPLQMGVEYSPLDSESDQRAVASGLRPAAPANDVRRTFGLGSISDPFGKFPDPLRSSPKIGLYRDFTGSMDEGWTRYVFDTFSIKYRSIGSDEIRAGKIDADVLVLPSESERSIVNGLDARRYPAEFAGGIGEAGIANLRRFVESGGRIVCFDESCAMLIRHFSLPLKNVVSDLKRNEFYDPGSILDLEVDGRSPLAKGMPARVPAFFTESSAYEAAQDAKVHVVAQYARENTLLSGWMVGEKYIAGRIALAEVPLGKGSIVVFGFRPQHRAQTWGTFPLLFNALEK